MRQPTLSARLLIVTLAVLGSVSGARGAALPDPTSPDLTAAQRLPALVERVRLEQERLKTLQAEFVQTRESELLLVPEESRGEVSFSAPDSVRWEYRSPTPIVLVIRGESMTTWYQDLGRADQLNIGKRSAQVLRYLGPGSSLETLLQYFNVNLAQSKDPAQPYRLDLKPRFERVAKRLREMSIWLDRERYLPVRLRYVEPSGDVTEYRFTALRLNQPIPPERFDLRLPAGVQVRKLGAASDSGQ